MKPLADYSLRLCWTSDRVGWEDLRPGLKSGLGSVMYLGHGEPGWRDDAKNGMKAIDDGIRAL